MDTPNTTQNTVDTAEKTEILKAKINRYKNASLSKPLISPKQNSIKIPRPDY